MMLSEFFSKAWSALVSQTIAHSPAIIAATALLILGFLVSWLLGALARRTSRGLGLDRQVAESGLTESFSRAALSKPPSAIIARLVFWLSFLCFLVLALENLGLDLSQLPVRTFVSYVPRLIGAVILLIAGLLLAVLLGKATDAGLASAGVSFHERFGAIVRWVLIALTVIATVDHLGFDVTLVTDTFSNVITIVVAGLALAFAWGGREVARNVLAAYYVRENFRPGDLLAVDGHEGRLEEIGPINSRLSTSRGSVSVPNSRLIEQTVETRSSGTVGDETD